MFKKLFFISFLALLQTIVLGQTKTYVGTNGSSWNTASNWSPSVIPTLTDDVIIPSGKSVNITANSFAKNVSVSGTLIINTGLTFKVFNNFIVNSGGNFDMGSGNDSSTLIVYGNYTNNGTTNFYKSDVIIVGDLITPATSGLQNQGNIIVGGSIIGDFNLTGGTGTNQIYALNPNATVSITPSSINTNVIPGTFPTGEAAALIALVNQVVYGNTCSFTINSIANVTTCSGTNAVFTVTTSGTSGIPTYLWEVNKNDGSGWVTTGVTSQTLTISGVTISMTNYKYRATVTAGSPTTCTKNGNYGILTVNAAPITPTINVGGSTTFCTGGSVTLTSSLGTTYLWSTGATTPSITVTNPGSYTVKVANESGCQSISSAANVVTVNAMPIITSQPITKLDCEGATVNFTAVATGTGLSYTWLRQKPTDSSFITIPIEGNISYPSTGVIKVDNVGSSQSPSGTKYQVVVSNSNGCSVTSSAATLLANEITAVLGSTDITQCYGTNYFYTVTTLTPSPGYVVSYKWKSSVVSGTWNDVVDGIHFSGATTATLTIINGTPSESGQYRVYVTFNSSGSNCNVSSTTRTRNITFLPLLTLPSVNATQPSCTISTGTISVNVQSANDKYSFDNGLSYQSSNIKFGLAVGNYDVIIKNISGCISPTSSVVLKSATNTWNGSVWSNGSVPISTENIVFSGDYLTQYLDITACSCNVNAGISVNINSGHTLTLTNNLSVDTPGFASMTFFDNAGLVQINNVSNYGEIDYQRSTKTFVRDTDFVYWSSPVLSQDIGYLSNKTINGTYFSYDSALNDWNRVYTGTSMEIGKGYIVRSKISGSLTVPSPYIASFVGKPNNGDISITGIIADKSYLIGNPYPSAINADAFLSANSGVLNGTLYFWTHKTAIQAADALNTTLGSGEQAYTSNDYATYNITGGVGIDLGTSTSAAFIGGSVPNGFIGAGQGFFASSKTSISSSSIIFNNAMRVAGSNTQFFKIRNPKFTKAIEKNRIWLNMTNTQGAFKQTLVGYITGATNGYDDRFDGESFDGNDFIDFYSVNDNKNLSIQGRALPFDDNDEVALGFKTIIEGKFTINIDQADGLLTNQSVYIEDKLRNNIIDLKSGPYTFKTESGTFNDRFLLRFTNNSTLNLESVKEEGILVLYSNNYKVLIVRNYDVFTTLESIGLYSLTGQQIEFWDVKENLENNINIPIANISTGIYVVKVKTKNGVIIKKIIVN
jgi:hypothetical protein